MPRLSLGFMSRIPMAHYEWHRPRFSRHAFLEIAPEGLECRVFGVHLSAVFAAWTETPPRVRAARAARGIKRHQHGFHALVGDFNTVTPGELLDFAALPQKVRATVWLSGGRIRWRAMRSSSTPATPTPSARCIRPTLASRCRPRSRKSVSTICSCRARISSASSAAMSCDRRPRPRRPTTLPLLSELRV